MLVSLNGKIKAVEFNLVELFHAATMEIYSNELRIIKADLFSAAALKLFTAYIKARRTLKHKADPFEDHCYEMETYYKSQNRLISKLI